MALMPLEREIREIEGARWRAQIAVKSSFPFAGSSAWPAYLPFFFSTLPSRPARLASEMKISPRFALAFARLHSPFPFSLLALATIAEVVYPADRPSPALSCQVASLADEQPSQL